MKKIGDIMEEIGFNKDSSNEVKKAFIKHLIKEAHYKSVQRESENSLEVLKEKIEAPEAKQLSLFDTTGTDN